MTTKQAMESALKEQCVPILRSMGFKGSFPNLRREIGGFVSLINFQFYSSGGSFCVNLSYVGPHRENVGYCPDAELNKVTVSHTRDRVRLGAERGDRWFSFGPTSYGECRGTPEPPSQIIAIIAQLIRDHAESWWNKKREECGASQQGGGEVRG
jgi:hypothetical protein